jgi:hypothetical protein
MKAATESTTVPAGTTRTLLDTTEIIDRALTEVRMRPDQAVAARKIGAQIAPMEAVSRATGNALVLALADQVEAGKMNGLALAPMIKALAVTKENLLLTIRDVLDRLHVLLDDEQRADFADAFEHGIHLNVALMSDPKRIDERLSDLALDEVQKQELHYVHEALVGMTKVDRHNAHRGIEGFRGEMLSLETMYPRRDIPAIVRARLATAFELLKGFVDILDSKQRSLLAEHLRKSVQERPVAAS